MINKILNRVFKAVTGRREPESKEEGEQFFKLKSMKKRLKIRRGYYDEFEFISYDCLIEEEMGDIEGELYTLESRVKHRGREQTSQKDKLDI